MAITCQLNLTILKVYLSNTLTLRLTQQFYRQEYLAAGMDAYLIKPILPERLQAEYEEGLEK